MSLRIAWIAGLVACAGEAGVVERADPGGLLFFGIDNDPIDPPILTLGWIAESDISGAALGNWVSSAGDVNGDQLTDVLVVAPGDGNGKVYLFLGSPSGPKLTAAWTHEPDQLDSTVEASDAGDVNGDGFGDVIVGGSEYANASTTGRVWVYLGSASGLEDTASWTAEGAFVDGSFGHAVSAAGDVNADGYGDVVISDGNGPTVDNAVSVYLGSAVGLEPVAVSVFGEGQPLSNFGGAVSDAGDVNGDGYDDVLVGDNEYDHPLDSEGAALVYLGSEAGTETTAAWLATSDQTDAFFGSAVSAAGDVNGDGYDDVVVGADSYTRGSHESSGRADVFYGSASGLEPTPAWSVQSKSRFAQLGASVSSAGDVNGDGFDDVVIGVPGLDVGVGGGGDALLYLGSPTGLETATVWWSRAAEGADGLGGSVSSAGDTNGDGYDDIIVGASRWSPGFPDQEGRALVFLGRCYDRLDTDGDGVGDACDACTAGVDVCPSLSAASPGVAGVNNEWVLTDAPPNATVTWLWSATLGATPAKGCIGLDLELASPNDLGSSVADASGRATLLRKVPAAASGKVMRLQAFLPDTCDTSNVASTRF